MSNQLSEPVRISEKPPVRVTPGPQSSVWGYQPVLRRSGKGAYLGRVVVQVWTDDETSMFAGPADHRSLARAAARVLGAARDLKAGTTPWGSGPIGANVRGQAFVGLAAIELWEQDSEVRVTGGSGVVARSVRHLQSFA